MKKMLTCIVLTIMMFSLILSCNIETGKTGKTGTLALNFPMAQSRTLLPDIDMTPASYDITGTGPNGATFSITTDQSTVEIPSLDFGDWTVVVDAINADEIIIGHGEATCTVHVGETTAVTITVIPLDGYGSVDLTVNWNAGDTEYPTIEAQLLPPSGSSIVLPLTITGGNTGTCVLNTIPTGYYTLAVKLLDGNPAAITPILTMGAVEIVRIVKDETTFGTFDFTQINKPGGTIQVNIDLQMADPIDVTLSGQEAELPVGDSMTVTASVDGDVGNVTAVWYINGDLKATGTGYTVNGLPVGVYRLDVTVFNTDGTRAGSAIHSFHVVEGPSYWAKTYGGSFDESPLSIIKQKNGGYFIVGYTNSFGVGGKDILVMRIDKAGNIIWQKTYGGTNDEAYGDATIIELLNGELMLFTDTNSFGASGRDLWVLKLDNNGDKIWEKRYGGAGDEIFGKAIMTSDNCYIIAGTTSSYNTTYDYLIFKIDSDGTIIWKKVYDTNECNWNGLDDIKETTDGGYIACGRLNYEAWVMKLTNVGDITWQYYYSQGDGGYDDFSSIHELSNGDFITTGRPEWLGQERFDIWVVRLNSDGSIEWQKTYALSHYNVNQDIPNGTVITDNENIIITGNYEEPGGRNIWTFELDGSNGNIIWQLSYNGNLTEMAPGGIILAEDNGYIIAGNTQSYGEGGYDFWLLKIDNIGNIPGADFITTTNSSPYTTTQNTAAFSITTQSDITISINETFSTQNNVNCIIHQQAP